MDIKEEVRRRIAELTRFAYERGYRDGAQSALVEIENVAAEDVVEQLGKTQMPLEAIAETKAVGKRSAKAKRTRVAKSKPKAKRAANGRERAKPKTLVVQEALQGMLAAKGKARRDEVLIAAQAENPAITKFDLGNGLRALVKQSKVRVSPKDAGLLLPV
ncbi:MAG: hypothetical protein ACR2Q4_06440 [Geminicoccaceae bacterium]